MFVFIANPSEEILKKWNYISLTILVISEYVVLCDYENNADYAAVKVKTNSLKKQIGINDGMINYTLDFEFAYDMINTVI